MKRDKMRGCLMAGAAGDALGYEVEFVSRKFILSRYGEQGVAQFLLDENGKVNTAHTTNPVPFAVCCEGIELSDGRLADIAPTILQLMGLEKPVQMDGVSLIK